MTDSEVAVPSPTSGSVPTVVAGRGGYSAATAVAAAGILAPAGPDVPRAWGGPVAVDPVVQVVQVVQVAAAVGSVVGSVVGSAGTVAANG